MAIFHYCSIGKRCGTFLFQSLECTCNISHLLEAGLSGYKASVSAGQKSGSDGKTCKASSHPKDSSHARLGQERAGWHRPAENMKGLQWWLVCVCVFAYLSVYPYRTLLIERLPHICSSSHGRSAPDIQHYSCQYHLLLEWLAGCRPYILEHTSFMDILEERKNETRQDNFIYIAPFEHRGNSSCFGQDETIHCNDI